jgi:hypothetical protein
MKQDLNKFLIFYNFNRGHGGLRKEIKVRTPYEALEYCYKRIHSVIGYITPAQKMAELKKVA